MALTKAKLIELIDNGDIDVGGGGVNPNILHNWDFRNPCQPARQLLAQSAQVHISMTDGYVTAGTVTVAAGIPDAGKRGCG